MGIYIPFTTSNTSINNRESSEKIDNFGRFLDLQAYIYSPEFGEKLKKHMAKESKGKEKWDDS